ncbi:MAG: hypothetical protein NTU60_08215 [Candidatus Aminicenantes bacterium]|nr:hypothetical protein [Candidatus Aminicenantes bacterium]
MAEAWLEQGEEMVGSWSVFVGDPTPNSEKITDHVAIPFSEIGEAKIVKKSLFQKALLVKLKSGEEFEFQFGAMSPQKVLDGITAKL